MTFKRHTALLPKTVGWLAVWTTYLLVAQSARAQKVKVDFDKKYDFSKIHHYEWRTHPIFEKHPELREQYSTAIQLVMSDSNQELMKKGFQPAETKPDIFLTFFVTAQGASKTYTDVIGGGYGYGWYGWYAPPMWTVTRTENYLEGTLVLDMVDPAKTQLVWRATATDAVKDFKNRDKNVESAVKKIFKKFPPKQK
jgi:hypothetical protein